ncbi:MAG: hypothetical protein WBA13_18995 [Microcoleaceae cyanobacterium]
MDTRPSIIKDWNPAVSKTALVFHAPEKMDVSTVAQIYEQIEEWLGSVANEWGEVRLMWDGAKQGLRKFSATMQSSIPSDDRGLMVIPELDSTLDELYYNPKPCYLTEMSTQKVIWMNPAAIQVNNLTRPSQMLNSSSASLWESDSMERMMMTLERDRTVPSFENIGYHWGQNGDGDLWRREKVATISDYKLVTAWNVTCRLCKTLSNEPA